MPTLVVYVVIGVLAIGVGVVVWVLTKHKRGAIQAPNESERVEQPQRIKWSLLLLIWNIALSIVLTIALVWGFKTATVQQDQTIKTLEAIVRQLQNINSQLDSIDMGLSNIDMGLYRIELQLK